MAEELCKPKTGMGSTLALLGSSLIWVAISYFIAARVCQGCQPTGLKVKGPEHGWDTSSAL